MMGFDRIAQVYRWITRLAFLGGLLIFGRECVVQVHDTYVVTQDFACLAQQSGAKGVDESSLIAQASLGNVFSVFQTAPVAQPSCNIKYWAGDFKVSSRAWYSGRPDYNRIPFVLWSLFAFIPAIFLMILSWPFKRYIGPVMMRMSDNRRTIYRDHGGWPNLPQHWL